MNTKPFFQQVISSVGETQDGKKLNINDEYGNFLHTLIKKNTQEKSDYLDAGKVDTEELESDLNYAIHEFTKALAAVKKFNN